MHSRWELKRSLKYDMFGGIGVTVLRRDPFAAVWCNNVRFPLLLVLYRQTLTDILSGTAYISPCFSLVTKRSSIVIIHLKQATRGLTTRESCCNLVPI